MNTSTERINANRFGPLHQSATHLGIWLGLATAFSTLCLITSASAQFLTPLSEVAAAPLGVREQHRVVPSYCLTEQLRPSASLRSVSASTDGKVVLAVGDHGTILRSDNGGTGWSLVHTDVEAQLSDVTWVSEKKAVAIGGFYDRVTCMSRARWLISRDAGLHWTTMERDDMPRLKSFLPVPGRLVANADWSTISRGSLFESSDGGVNWQRLNPTEASRLEAERELTARNKMQWVADMTRWRQAIGGMITPRCYSLVGENSLVVVGDHGTIAKSNDRGVNWQIVHGKNRHVAVLFVCADESRVPWSLIGRETIEHQRRAAILIRDPQSNFNASGPSTIPSHLAASPNGTTMDCLQQAAMGLAVSAVDRLSTSPVGERSEQEIQNWISIHQPTVVVLDDQLSDLTQRGFLTAAMTTNVQRVVSYSIGKRGHSLLLSNALLPKSGVLAGDFWQDAFHRVAPAEPIPSVASIQTLYESSGNTARTETIAAGLHLDPGQSLSEKPNTLARRRLQITQARQRNTATLDELMVNAKDAEQFEAALQSVLDQTAPEDRFRMAWYVVRHSRELLHGQGDEAIESVHDAAAEVFQTNFPDASASSWLNTLATARQHSAEQSRRMKRPTLATGGSSGLGAENPFGDARWDANAGPGEQDAALPDSAGVDVAVVSPFQDPKSAVVQASAVSSLPVPRPNASNTLRPSRSGGSGEVDLSWEMHPLTLLVRTAEKRMEVQNSPLSESHASTANLEAVARSDSTWSSLLDSFGPRTLVAQQASSGPPRLDGDFSDACWQSSAKFALNQTEIRCAHDERFVYFAIRCPANSFRIDRSTMAAGHRDCDLEKSDRIRLRMDLDQDLVTSMQLEFNAEGKTRDRIDHPTDWQPTWYIAPSQVGEDIQFEIAISRSDLIGNSSEPLKSWFVSAELLSAGETESWQVVPDPSEWIRVEFR